MSDKLSESGPGCEERFPRVPEGEGFGRLAEEREEEEFLDPFSSLVFTGGDFNKPEKERKH